MHYGPVLIVETDSTVSANIASSLKAEGFEVRQADLGEAVPAGLDGRTPNMDLLDCSTPQIGEMEATHTPGSLRQPIAVIVLITQNGHENLVARLLRAIGHASPPQSRNAGCLQVGDICLDALAHRVTKAAQNVHLTPKEFRLLRVLMEHAGLPLTHRRLLELVWGPEYGSRRDYLRIYISQLRRKLERNPSSPEYLLTETHMGYRFQQPSEIPV